MKLFARRRQQPEAPSDGYSIIDEHLAVVGDISTDGTVRVDGRVEGSLHRTNTMIIGAGATLVGNVEAREVVIGGDVRGNLVVSGRVEVQKTGTVHGDIRAAAVMLEEGGTVHGHVLVLSLDADEPEIGSERRLMLTPSRGIAAQG
jgi:cytoskeletal protein CcmA (bactofilin family)